MMNKYRCIFVILLLVASLSISADNLVYVCTSPDAKKYHFNPYCSRLHRCTYELATIRLSRARRIYEGPCKVCIGYSSYSSDNYYDDRYYERKAREEEKRRKAEEKRKAMLADNLKGTLFFAPSSYALDYPFPVVSSSSASNSKYYDFIYRDSPDLLVESWERYEIRKHREMLAAEEKRIHRLAKKQEVKNRRNFGYIGATAYVGSYNGIGLNAGLYYWNINIEGYASASFSMSNDIYWYDDNGIINDVPSHYRPYEVGVALGYGIDIGSYLKVVPVACINHIIVSNDNDDTISPRNSYVTSFAPGIKFDFSIGKKCRISILPEYNYRKKQGKVFELISSSPFDWKIGDGFSCSLSVNYKL